MPKARTSREASVIMGGAFADVPRATYGSSAFRVKRGTMRALARVARAAQSPRRARRRLAMAVLVLPTSAFVQRQLAALRALAPDETFFADPATAPPDAIEALLAF